MATLTFILGMERFNAHVWSDVEELIRAAAPDVRILRFHDGHVEQRDPRLAQAIAEADIIMITLINMRGLADWLAEHVGAAKAKAVFAFESMPEVMALNKVGDYRVSGGGRSAMPKPMQAILRLITRGRDEDTLYAYTKLTRAATKLLPLMPAKLKDFRTWLSVNIYWNQPDVTNITQMVRLMLRDCLGYKLEIAQVRPIPTMGCFHPQADQFFDDPKSYFKWYDRHLKAPRGSERPLVALIAFRKHVVQRQRYHADLIAALEQAGLAVLPLFVSGIEMHVAVRDWLLPSAHKLGRPLDLLINSMGFPLVGGPAGSTKPGHYREQSAEILQALNVPYMITQPLQMQDEQHWRANGVAPMQAVIMFDLPEMDGSIAPVTLGAIRGQEIVATPDRLARAARQAAGWARLRRIPVADRRVAIVLYNFPPGLGRLGTAALLDVPASLHAILQRMQQEGYRIPQIPHDPTELAKQIMGLGEPETPAWQGVGLPLAEYRQITPTAHADRVDRYWGAPPGDIAPHGRDALRIDGMQLGNAFVGVQPSMGAPGDPLRLLFDREFTPHHQYLGFYRWLSQRWKADVVIHLGMHGTAEWMPGLQLGLTGDCWPDLLLGELPHIYLYPLNNPSEAAIAKRRGYAAIVSHIVPPFARAGLYKQLAQARAQLESGDLGGIHLPDVPPIAGESSEIYHERVRRYLDTLEQRLILDGLHTFGQPPSAERAATLIEAALDIPRDGQPTLSRLLAEAGVEASDLGAARAQFVLQQIVHPGAAASVPYTATLRHAAQQAAGQALIQHGRAILHGLAQTGNELDALMRALNGGYLLPAAGADPVRAGAAALPSGRNIHSIDPWRLPSDLAFARGWEIAERLLEQHGAPLPATVAMPLWALDTIKTEGESIAAVLALVGARPERDGQGKIWRYDLVPLAELGRPRIDVLLDISSIFRDTFQLSLDLLDDLFRRAAAAEEPADQNFIRAHALDLVEQGQSWEHATARIFTQAPGKYGTGVDALVEESAWEQSDELAETFIRRGAHTYGGGRAGAPAPEVLRGLLGTVGQVFQAIDSVEYGLTDMQHYYGHSGALQLAAQHAQGRTVPLSYAETFTGHVQVSSAKELIQIEARAKLLNPKWYESMLKHGFAGAAEIGNRFSYLVGWSATTGQVDGWVYQGMAETFVLDEAMRQRLTQANPRAAQNAVARLLEAHGRGLWAADEATIEQLQAIYGDLEDRLEGAIS
jgi:magnesium chelatase subunit H